ncbi:uncharacterized protein LOC144101941 isoform X2 [Amblyomma americanum]
MSQIAVGILGRTRVVPTAFERRCHRAAQETQSTARTWHSSAGHQVSHLRGRMIASGVENRVAGAEAGGHSDIYGVEKCVELYDAAIAPVVPAVAALLDSFQTAFLDLPIDEATEESGVRHKRQFIDVGCGPGSFTLKHLLPRLPPWCEKLVAVDNSESMLKFARENRSDPKIEYQGLDVLADEAVARFVRAEGRFQRVYSFLVLHWIADHRHALRNIEALTAPAGECFLVFSNNLAVFDVFTAMMRSARWSKYSDVLLRVLPETRDMEDVISLRSHLVSVVRATSLLPLACEVFRLTGDMGLSKERALAMGRPGARISKVRGLGQVAFESRHCGLEQPLRKSGHKRTSSAS